MNGAFGFKKARVSIYVLIILAIVIALFYVISSLFTGMGYSAYKDAIALTEQASQKVTIVIDPGHGGEDPGAECNGIIEKDINLATAKYLAALLKANGHNVIMTRDADVMLYNEGDTHKKSSDLINRTKIAGSAEDPVFVSIHMNKFPLEYCKGLQTFYSENSPLSAVLADSIQTRARCLQPDNKREVKSAGGSIYVLSHLDIPAVLVECGFISNNEEAGLLVKDSYQRQLALVIYCGITDYLSKQ